MYREFRKIASPVEKWIFFFFFNAMEVTLW